MAIFGNDKDKEKEKHEHNAQGGESTETDKAPAADPLAQEPDWKEEPPKAQPANTDGKVTMKKNGVGRRFHESKISEMQSDGWELVK